MRFPVAEGVGLHANTWSGEGVPFLLVHGLASNGRTWDGVADALAGFGHPVAALDLRGHGRSDKPDDGYGFETVAADLVASIDALAFDRPVAVGQSWGGNLVLHLAHRAPDRVRGIAGVDGGTIELTGRFPTWPVCAATLAPPRTTGMARTDVEAMLRRTHADWPESGIQGALACWEVREDGTVAPWLSPARHELILRALWEHRPSRLYPEVRVPVLLVPADNDEPWTVHTRAEVTAAEAALPRCRTRWFSPADHDVQAQFPRELAEVLHDCVEDGFFS